MIEHDHYWEFSLVRLTVLTVLVVLVTLFLAIAVGMGWWALVAIPVQFFAMQPVREGGPALWDRRIK